MKKIPSFLTRGPPNPSAWYAQKCDVLVLAAIKFYVSQRPYFCNLQVTRIQLHFVKYELIVQKRKSRTIDSLSFPRT